jgi:hypothetical protein
MPTLLLRLAALFIVALTSTPAHALQAGPWIRCTPTSVKVGGRAATASTNPIAEALRNASPGSVIEVEPGDYPSFRLGFGRGAENADVSGTKVSPIVVRALAQGPGRVRIRTKGKSDALMIDQKKPVAYITFEGLEFEPGYRSAVIFYRQHGGAVHRGFRFVDCDIIGGWDHVKAAGVQSKWGVSGHRIADFEWIGLRRPSIIRDLKSEHGFYLQNCAGNVTIENVEATRLGRTFCQFTARSSDGPAGLGHVVVKNCRISDTGIAAGDAYKGGSAFTITGNMPKASFLFEGNTYRGGFNPRLKKLTRPGVPFGTGAFVVWAEKDPVRLGKLVLKDNDFRFAKDSGDRPVVAIGAVENVQLVGNNRFDAGAFGVALSIDPPQSSGLPHPLPVRKISVASTTTLNGRLEVAGHTATAADRTRLGLTPR